MINTRDRIEAFAKLGGCLLDLLNHNSFNNICVNAKKQNPWFNKASIVHAFEVIGPLLTYDNLLQWVKDIDFDGKSKKVGVIIPSNIPLVGFIDFLSVLISGHFFTGKLSSSNNLLLPFVANIVINIDSRFADYITFSEDLINLDIIIATGSDSSANYFNFNYRNCSKLIVRKNRTSVAILNGSESYADYKFLFMDIVTYFGLGCRNVTKLFLPANFNWNMLTRVFNECNYYVNENYLDNLKYQKSLLNINGISFLYINNLLFVESSNLNSSISVIHYEFYDDLVQLSKKINSNSNSIQCVVSNCESFANAINFGQAQSPNLHDWADGVNILNTLNN